MPRRTSRVPGVVAFAFLLVAGCGGGGGGGGGGPPAGPEVARVFPPFGGVTEADSITVRGTASSPDGISGVVVAGVPATSGDGFATWSAEVQLAAGLNDLPISATSVGGAVATLPAVTVRHETAILGQPYGIAYDAPSATAYVLGGADPRLFAYDEAAHVATVVAGPTKGSGPDLKNAYPMVLHTAAGKAYVTTNWSVDHAVLAVDLSTGDRTIVSGPAVGTGTAFGGLADLELDVAGNRLLVSDFSTAALFWVDLATGNRTVVSSDAVGAGPTFQKGSATTTVLDLAHGRAFVAQNHTYFVVSLATGDRTVFSEYPAIGAGPPASSVQMAYDAVTDKVIVGTRQTPTTFVSIDPTTGERVLLPAPAAPPGAPICRSITGIAHDVAGGRLLAADWEGSAIRSYHLADGVQADVWRTGRGVGVEMAKAGAATLASDDRMLLLDEMIPDVLVSVDLVTGDRTVLDGGGVPMPNNSVGGLGALTADLAHGRALYAGPYTTGVVAVDLVTGLRTALSPGTAGFGPTFASGALGVDTDGTSAWIVTASTAQVLEVDLATGLRTTLSAAGVGLGPVFSTTYCVLPDLANSRLLVGADFPGDSGIFAVDLATGDRSAVFASAQGAFLLGTPTALAHGTEPSSVLALVAQQVYDIDVVAATQTLVASQTVGKGLRFGSPIRLSHIRSDGIVVMYDGSTNAIVALDPTTGERLAISK